MINAILIDPADSVATVLTDVAAGTDAEFVRDGETLRITARQRVPRYHKIAVRETPQGGSVIKYGESIGLAIRPIRPGDHVHTDNLSSDGR